MKRKSTTTLRCKTLAVKQCLNNGLSIREAALKYNLSKSYVGRKVKRIRHHGDDMSCLERPSGRPRLISEETRKKIDSIIKYQSRIGDCVDESQLEEIIRKAYVQQEKNKYGEENLSGIPNLNDRVIKRIKNTFADPVKAALNTNNRLIAINDIRNFVSMACVLYGILFHHTNENLDEYGKACYELTNHNVWNMDPTTLVLCSESVRFEKVYASKDVKDSNRRRNISISKSSNISVSNYFRIKFCCFTNAAGKLGIPVFTIKMDKAQDTMEHIELEKFIHSEPAHIYLLPNNYSQQNVYKTIFEEIMFPHMEKICNDMKGSFTDINEDNKLFILDGDIPQQNAVDLLEDYLKRSNIMVFKPPAGATATCQPNDAMRGYALFKFLVGNKKLKYSDEKNGNSRKTYVKQLENFLNDKSALKPNQKQIILKFFDNAPAILNQAFSINIIQKG